MQGRGETGDPRENPPTDVIVQHDSHVWNSRSDPAGNRTLFALVRDARPGRLATEAASLISTFTRRYDYFLVHTVLDDLQQEVRQQPVPRTPDVRSNKMTALVSNVVRQSTPRKVYSPAGSTTSKEFFLSAPIRNEARSRASRSQSANIKGTATPSRFCACPFADRLHGQGMLSDWLLHAAEGSLLAALPTGNRAGMKWQGKLEIPRKGPSGTISTCENAGVNRPGIERGSHCWEASSLTAQPPSPLIQKVRRNREHTTYAEVCRALNSSVFIPPYGLGVDDPARMVATWLDNIGQDLIKVVTHVFDPGLDRVWRGSERCFHRCRHSDVGWVDRFRRQGFTVRALDMTIQCLVWYGSKRTMVSTNTDTNRTGVLAVVDIGKRGGAVAEWLERSPPRESRV
ncbi:hypothetical protein PR048_023239 [Dryococelus australis]|uniref:Uncharacterized protein n=1 Tax=Dryococelus australis TaxID=614101 RepID=A0ABQ9GTI4_9NEOP|nr:hypothetical protein PR048_023239 [Dryococelus australis]